MGEEHTLTAYLNLKCIHIFIAIDMKTVYKEQGVASC